MQKLQRQSAAIPAKDMGVLISESFRTRHTRATGVGTYVNVPFAESQMPERGAHQKHQEPARLRTDLRLAWR
jgi:hypothetical protein